MTTAIEIKSIYRYPVKGLSPERLPEARLTPGEVIQGDRRFAMENGPSGFDMGAPAFLPKSYFLMLMRNERLAALSTRFDDASGALTIRQGDRTLVQGDLAQAEGRAAIEHFFADYMKEELRGSPKLLEAPGHSFSDYAPKVVSLINLASVADLGEFVGRELDPLRFRGNLHVSGLEPWAELDLVGRTLTGPDALTLEVVKRIRRCAATNVDPKTAIREGDLPATLQRRFGHMDCGIYARVVEGGRIGEGDQLRLAA
jgi:uncharacterized protein YcbX